MKLACSITRVSQEMSFEENRTVTYVELELPTGGLVHLVIDEETAAEIIAAAQSINGTIPSSAGMPGVVHTSHTQPAPAPVTQEEETIVFGGGDTSAPIEEVTEQISTTQAIPPPPIVKIDDRSGVPHRTVQKDEFGYPVIATSSSSVSMLEDHTADGTESI